MVAIPDRAGSAESQPSINPDTWDARWFKVPHALIEHMHAMPKSAVLTLLVLMHYANGQGQAWPSAKTIELSVGISRRSVYRAIAWLAQHGFIRRLRRKTPTGGDDTTVYELHSVFRGQSSSQPAGGFQAGQGGSSAVSQGWFPGDTGGSSAVSQGWFPGDTGGSSLVAQEQEYPIDTPLEYLPCTPVDNQFEQDLVNKKARSPQSFKKPTVQEIAAYCKARGNTVDPQAFWDFYESKGWRVGNTPMKDWQAAVRTWERRPQYGNGQPSPKAKPKKTNHVYLN